MEKRKKIGIDLDSTLNNLEEVWVNRYNEDYNDNIVQFGRWDVHNTVKPECGAKIYNYLTEPQFFFNLDIKKDAKEVVHFLSKKYDLYVVTAYVPEACMDKTNWIKKQNLSINPKNIIFINNKGLLGSSLHYLIDDGPHNFEYFKGTGLIFDMPYNQDMEKNNKRIRVKNWSEIKTVFENELTKKEYLTLQERIVNAYL